jgi:hypothetical protein
MVPPEGTTENSPVTPPGIDPGTIRLVAQCLNHYATPGLPQNRAIQKKSAGSNTIAIISVFINAIRNFTQNVNRCHPKNLKT